MYTPELNCGTNTIGIMAAVELLPVRGMRLSAMPSTALVESPRMHTHANVTQADTSKGVAR